MAFYYSGVNFFYSKRFKSTPVTKNGLGPSYYGNWIPKSKSINFDL